MAKDKGITSSEFHCLLICVGLLNPSAIASAILRKGYVITQDFIFPIGNARPICHSLERKGLLEEDGNVMRITEKGIRILSNFLPIAFTNGCQKMRD